MSLAARSGRLVRRGLSAVLALILGLAAALSWLAGTEAGARWSWGLARLVVPGTLNAHRIHGRLMGPFVIEDLRWTAPDGRSLAVREVGWALQPRDLLQGVLRITYLRASGIHYHHVPRPEAPPPRVPESIRLPVAVQVDEAQLAALRLDMGGGTPLEIAGIRLRARAHHRLQILQLGVDADALHTELTGEAGLRTPYPFSATLRWRGRSEILPLRGSAHVRGDRDTIRLEAHTRGSWEADLEADARLQPARALDVRMRWTRLQWPLRGAATVVSPQGEFLLHGPIQAWKASLQAELLSGGTGEGAAPIQLEAGLRGGTDHARVERLRLDAADHGRLEAQGRLTWGDTLSWVLEATAHRLPLDAAGLSEVHLDAAQLQSRGEWSKERIRARVRLPEARLHRRERSLRISALEAEIHGPREALEATATVRTESTGLPPLALQAQARLTPARLTLQRLDADLLGGHLSAQGHARLDPPRSWRLQLRGQGLDPGKLAADWHGALDAQADLRGTLSADALRLEIDGLRVQGRVQERPVDLQVRGVWSGTALEIEKLTLETAENHLRAQGRVARRGLDIDLRLDLARLEHLWPGLRGRLRGRAKLSGDPSWPEGEIRLDGARLGWRTTVALQRLELAARLHGRDQDSRIDLRAGTLRLRELRWKTLTLAARGRPDHHRIRARAQGDLGLDLEARGTWSAHTWRGLLRRLELATERTGPWGLEHPVRVAAGTEGLDLEHACLHRDQARICLRARGRTHDDWTVDGEVRHLPLAWLADPALGDRAHVEGDLHAELKATGDRPIPRLAFEAHATDAALVVPVEAQAPVRLPVETLRAELRSDGARARFTLEAEGPVLRLEAGGEADGFDRSPRTRGRFQLAMADLGFIHAWVPDLSLHAGRLEGSGHWDGPLQHPAAGGDLALTGLDLELADLGIRLREGALRARLRPERIDLEGSLRSGQGTLRLDGGVIPDPTRGWPYAVHLTGRDVEFLRTAEILAVASPDLRLQGTTRALEVTGRIELPKTLVELEELPPGTVKASEDQVIVGEQRDRGPRAPFDARVDVLVVLGEEVRFKGFGLETRLSGKLRVLQEPGGPLRGEGVLSFKTGKYRIYGVDLDLERGRLLFTGRLDNPALDFRAVRRIDDVTVGVEVTGTVENPRSHLFSTPPMDDANILAYLVRGKPLSEAAEVDKEAMLAAALSMGLGPVTSRIAKQLGVDLKLNTGQNVNETTLGVGRRLNPKLYVEYVVGLFDRSGLFKLTYKLTRHLELVTESGEQQAVDIKYRIENDTWPFTRSSRSKSSISTTPASGPGR